MPDASNIWLWVGIGCVALATILFLIRKTRKPPGSSRHVSASRGGIAIGGDNNGIAVTGSQSPRQSTIPWEWIIGVVGIIIAVLAWLFPQAP